jgi:hypothetical protein
MTAMSGAYRFGDLFLRDATTGEYAILVTESFEVVDTGETDETGFRETILANPDVHRTLLRAADANTVALRLGSPRHEEIFIPVPLPALGGSGQLDTYQRGGLWEYLSIAVQSLSHRQVGDG